MPNLEIHLGGEMSEKVEARKVEKELKGILGDHYVELLSYRYRCNVEPDLN